MKSHLTSLLPNWSNFKNPLHVGNLFWSCLGAKASTVDPCWPHRTQARSKWGESVVSVVGPWSAWSGQRVRFTYYIHGKE
jgi:hypothetical protein